MGGLLDSLVGRIFSLGFSFAGRITIREPFTF